MNSLNSREIRLWMPEGAKRKKTLRKVSHLGIGAHSDDLEMVAIEGILKHFKAKRNNFFGIVVSDNRGNPIHPKYKNYSPSKIQQIREAEQIKAARLGGYAGVAFLRFPSRRIKNKGFSSKIENALTALIEKLAPSVIYTHSLFDQHPTHVAVAKRVIFALRKIPKKKRPSRIYGTELWKSLDWLSDKNKVLFDVSGYEKFLAQILQIFESQRVRTHRYDIAAISRMRANAIYHKTHRFSKSSALIYAMDLTPLIKKASLTIDSFTRALIRDFQKDLH